MVFRLELTYSGIEKMLDTKDAATSSTRYTLLPRLYEITDINLMLKSVLPDETKLKITFVDIRLRSNLTTNKTLQFTSKSLF